MNKQPEPRRFYVRSPDGRPIFGFDEREGAATAARAYGDGAFLVDTQTQAYLPMLRECLDGEVVYSGYGGWDTGRFGVDRDLIVANKKGHVAIVHAFLAKGADVNTCDAKGGLALIARLRRRGRLLDNQKLFYRAGVAPHDDRRYTRYF